jgi:uncharacterized protein (DUF427 family)
MKAIWKGQIIAESNETIVIEGNHYFPPESIKKESFVATDTHTTCPWKGLAHYYTVTVNGESNTDAAWYYPIPKDGSIDIVGKDFSNYVAFWKGVSVVSE